jgi:hypothetical protein
MARVLFDCGKHSLTAMSQESLVAKHFAIG